MNNPNLVQLIRKIADETVTYMKPSDWYVGQVEKVSPLKVKIGRSLILPNEFIVETAAFSERKLKKGTKVLLIRKWGGQKYIAVDTVK